MLCIFLLRDVFESFKCCLDFWLSSLLDYIHICVFPLFEKPVFIKLDSFSIDLNRQLSIEPIGLLFSIDLNASSIHWNFLEFVSITSRQILDPLIKFLPGLLDSFSIHWGIFAVNRFSIAPRQINLSRISARQILDRSLIHRDAFSLNSFSTISDFIYLILSQ